LERRLELTGEAVAVETVVISSTIEGPISYCPWREGDRVEVAPDKPVRLIEINRELYRAEVLAAAAILKVARAKLADMQAGTRPEEIAKAKETVRRLAAQAVFAKEDLGRITRLVASDALAGDALERAQVEAVTTQAELDFARSHLAMLEAGPTKTAVEVQAAAVKETQARLDLAQARLNECVVMAPFSGTVTRVYVRSGDMAVVKAPLLELANLDSAIIRTAVPESYAAAIREGMMAYITLDASPGKTFKGKIVRLFPDLDRRMRTRTVELAVNAPGVLVPGMFARVLLVLEAVENTVTVPVQALSVTSSGEQIVYVAADDKAVLRKVRTGIEQAGRIQITAGLEVGEQVVAAGYEKLKDGMEIRVAQPRKGTDKTNAERDLPAKMAVGAP
jgi:multidrug efflux pump subunit AcrA (membrane-fusion protein)